MLRDAARDHGAQLASEHDTRDGEDAETQDGGQRITTLLDEAYEVSGGSDEGCHGHH